MSAGDSAANSGLKPLNSTVRSSAGGSATIGMVASSLSTAGPPTPWVSEM